jgi:alpha-mannosidase
MSMLLTEAKLEARIRELGERRYRAARVIGEFAALEDEQKAVNGLPPEDSSWRTMRIGDNWSGRDAYLWLRQTVQVPLEWSGKTVLGRFDFGNTGGGNNSGFESLLYVDGQIYQGVDSNHQEVLLPGDAAGRQLALMFRLWSGLEGGGVPRLQEHKLARAELCWLDEAADDLYYLALAALETVRQLPEQQPERTLLLTALDQALRLLDWSEWGSQPGQGAAMGASAGSAAAADGERRGAGGDAFYASVGEARSYLRDELEAIGKRTPVTVHAIGHTHIDVAWLWRLKHTREKCARSFSTVLRLMERYPDYVFLQTQPQLYEYVKQDFPELYEAIRERVKEGRWEAAGGMWLEADCNLTSGESLVRQLLYGTRFLREEFGVDCTYLWLPDVFGYSWALPQILKKSGIAMFMTTKISWNQFNRMPHDTFRWRGLDGSEVLTHFITTPEPWSEPGSWFYTYNGRISAKTVKGIWDAYRDKSINRELLLSYGYGDGGGGVNRDMLELRRRLDLMPGVPQVKTGRADEYFAGLQERIASTTEYVHTWDGELYLEYHRGTYTSQASNKRMNRKLELLYRETEWLASLAGAACGRWSADDWKQLASGWKILLRNQFHDIIPGSSIREVYEDSRAEYVQAQALAQQVAANSAAMLLNERPGSLTLLNSAGWTQSGLAEIAFADYGLAAGLVGAEPEPTAADQDASAAGVWTDASGRILAAQPIAGGWLVETPQLQPLSLASIRFTPAYEAVRPVGAESGCAAETSPVNPPEAVFTVRENGLTTPFYELEWDAATGQLTRLYDRAADREVLAAGCRGNVLHLFEDKPLAHEAWDIDIFYQEKSHELRQLVELRLVEAGPLRASIRFVWQHGASELRQLLTVYAHSRRIDFRTEADWYEHQQLLKVAFPVAVRSTEATYDIQFGNVKRPTHWNTSWDYARFESVGQQWADLSERGYGVSLLNDCKYGYDIKDNVIRLSLIKCALHPDPEADQGRHVFTYSLLPHRGDWLAGDTVREAWALNNPITALPGESAWADRPLLSVTSPQVQIDAVKQAEDDERLVVRLHEFAGGRTTCRLTSGFRIVSWQECDLLERPQCERSEGTELTVEFGPYEIKTFLVELAPLDQGGE